MSNIDFLCLLIIGLSVNLIPYIWFYLYKWLKQKEKDE